MILTSTTFPILLDLCIRYLLAQDANACAAIAAKVLHISPLEPAFRLIQAVCSHALAPQTGTSAPPPHPASPLQSEVALPSSDDLEKTDLALEAELVTSPLNVASYISIGSLYERSSRYIEASRAFALAITLKPQLLDAYEGLLRCYAHLGRLSDAIHAAQRCESHPSADGQWLVGLGDMLIRLNHRDLAKHLYRTALPKLANDVRIATYLTLAELEAKDNNLKAREEWLMQALQLAPDEYTIQRELVNGSLTMGNLISAKKFADEFFARNPRSLGLFIAKISLALQPVYPSQQHLEQARQAVIDGLKVLKESLPVVPDRIVPDFEQLISSLNSFYLPYHGQSVVDIQREFAAISQSAIHRAVPPPSLLPRTPLNTRKIRVGFLSAYFRDHSNFKIPIKGWLQELDRNSFEIYGYHLSELVDSKTEESSRYCDRFVQGPFSLQQWLTTINNDALDVLIFPEIGMDPTCRLIANYRLAPVQVNSWGHPVTSGLSTIDYFLSSELMEGPESDGEYTEKLIRLPLLSINYEPPRRAILPLERSHFGIRKDAFALWCCQVIYKHLPQFDWVYPEIASRTPNSQFVFITIQSMSEPAQLFKQRLKMAFEAKGLNPEKHLLFLSSMKADEFATAASLCDLSLDAFEWSGCNSTLETLAQGVPVITTPGRFMRGRHTEAILHVIQCQELIAPSPQDYIDLAVALSLDPKRLQLLREKVRANIHLAYNDTSCVRELERYLKEWARTEQQPQTPAKL
jgi:protein O-GlcNAc transferase